MKLLKKLLPTAIGISSIAALTPTIVGCSSTNYAKLTWSFIKDGKENLYEDHLPLIQSKNPLNEKQATKLYFDNINKNGNRLASDVMYNIDADIIKLPNREETADKFDVTFEVIDIALESDLISLSFKFDLYSQFPDEEETHSYFYVNNMKYSLYYCDSETEALKHWTACPHKANSTEAEEVEFLKKDKTWSIDAYYSPSETPIPESSFNYENFWQDASLDPVFKNIQNELIRITTNYVHSMNDIKYSSTI